MLRLWVSVPWTGDGTDDNPYRPDVSAIEEEVAGWSLAGTDGVDAIAYVVTYGKQNQAWVDARVDVLHGEDEIDERGRRDRIPDHARDAVQNRAKQMGLPEVAMEQIDVNLPELVS